MKTDYYDDEDFDYEIEELENDYGSDFSNEVTKFVNSGKSNHRKEKKFKKDGYFEKNRK